MRFAELEGRRVALWGLGREGHASLAAWRRHLPGQPLTLFLSAREAAAQDFPPGVALRTTAPDAAALAAFDAVIKSPGISIYRPEIAAAQACGTRFTSATALWFGENPGARIIAITGTKGKSTTAALTAHLARSAGVRTALAGNIGLPMLALDGRRAALWVLELSSFQTGAAGAVEVGVLTSLYQEHLDWHGSYERYVRDKLKLARVARTLVVNGIQPELDVRTQDHPCRRFFARPEGWHLGHDASGVECICRGAEALLPLTALPLSGHHNARNACAALAALEAAGYDARAMLPALREFKPLPHRLQHLGVRAGVEWVNDSISTTPQASLAALESLGTRPVTLIVGGFDRGLEWRTFAAAVQTRADLCVLTQGGNGPRIAACLQEVFAAHADAPRVEECTDFDAAVARARALTPAAGVVLLSPGAPSFDAFANYKARGAHFAALAGFAGGNFDTIPGLGIR